jgi:GT2 family glycosyltransferase
MVTVDRRQELMYPDFPDGTPAVAGKFLEVNGQRILIKGVSYGTFAPNSDGLLFPEVTRVAHDFEAIAELDANTVRTYTPPPIELLDEAARCGLRVIVGLPWMQHVAFLNRTDSREIRRSIREQVKALADHPASLLFTLGNEIPPSVVRWYGRQRIERFLRELHDEAKSAAPAALLAYVNYPPTEYLEIPFFDVCAFNVFLHSQKELSAYLARLHHVAGARPLLLSELGADSIRNGEDGQAALVGMQVGTALREGACGAIVFSWTDEWWRGGRAVDDWAFGLVDAKRRPKRVYLEVQRVFRSAPFGSTSEWPRVSVAVCAFNAAATIDECLDALERLNYPDYEILVVDDGSTDGTGVKATRFPSVRVITTPNSGLSAARNVALRHATGEIIAYTDADVRVDAEWLAHLVRPFVDPDVAGAGGPAVVPPDDHWFAQCVARAPGSPTHVLLDDRIAEHVPGCNCAFRRDSLEAIGGFNPAFVRAGDDVDVCWRVQAAGWKIAFAPAALVWHRHRSTTRAYWRQQIGYGEGETWLMREHPAKFTRGRIAWRGHIYSPLPFIRSLRTKRINAGPFGTAGFPSVYRTDAHPFAYLPHAGRWQIAWVAMLVAGLASLWADLAVAPPLLAASVATLTATLVKCGVYAVHSDVSVLPPIHRYSQTVSRGLYRVVIAWLHFVQPFARLWGRVRGYLNLPAASLKPAPPDAPPVARRAATIVEALRLCLGLPVEKAYWSERWLDVGEVVRSAADRLRRQRAVRQIELDSGWWEDRDLTVVDRAWFRLDVRTLVEDHGGGRCLHRFAIASRVTGNAALPVAIALAAVFGLRYAGMSLQVASAIVAAVSVIVAVTSVRSASGLVLDAVESVAVGLGMTPVTATSRTAAANATAASVSAELAGFELTSRAMVSRSEAAADALSDA